MAILVQYLQYLVIKFHMKPSKPHLVTSQDVRCPPSPLFSNKMKKGKGLTEQSGNRSTLSSNGVKCTSESIPHFLLSLKDSVEEMRIPDMSSSLIPNSLSFPQLFFKGEAEKIKIKKKSPSDDTNLLERADDFPRCCDL